MTPAPTGALERMVVHTVLLFNNQKNDPHGIKYFPLYLGSLGLDPTPRVTIKPATTSVRYHWHNPQNTIYVANTADSGLCWDLLDWAENL